MYAKTIRLNISDVQDYRCLYDFLNALRSIDVTFVFDRKTILNYEVQQRKTSSFILDLIENFRNHSWIVRTLFNQIEKSANYSAFAILQDQDKKLASNEIFNHKDSDSCEHSRTETTENSKSASILLVIEVSDKKYSNRLCEMSHRYMKCLYIRLWIRQFEWKSDQSILKIIKFNIAKAIDEMTIILDHILKRDANAANKKKETRKSNKSAKSSNNVSIENFENFFYSFFATFSAFAIDSISYKFLNCWILKYATNIHVCNNQLTFQINRLISFEN
jgi:hypothetical protein